MNRIDAIIERVIARESDKFTDNPIDSGGPTKYGITQGALQAWLGRPVAVSDVAALDRSTALQFYFARQVHAPQFDAICAISESVGAELIDTGTLTGPARAAMFLQRCLNAFNRGGTLYPDVAVDGEAGQRTRTALRSFLAGRGKEGETVLVAAMNSLLGGFLIDLAERRPKDEEFAYGWIKARVVEVA